MDFFFAETNSHLRQHRDTLRPMLIVFHGLEGSSQSHYAQSLADWAHRNGWDCAIPHFRGCSGELNLAPRAYHSGDFAEISWMLTRFSVRFSGQPFYALGISLGGNALLRYLGECAKTESATPLAAAAAVCAPLDLERSSVALEQGVNRWLYTPHFLRSMKRKAIRQLQIHPHLFDATKLMRVRTIRDFDDVYTAPLHGFQNALDYYQQASSLPYLKQSQVCPVLVVNPLNDPFVPRFCLPKQNEVHQDLTLWQPSAGGHVGFLHPQRSLVQVAATWLQSQGRKDKP